MVQPLINPFTEVGSVQRKEGKMDKVAVIGAGMVGRAWASVFARADLAVGLYDVDGNALETALTLIASAAQDMYNEGLINCTPSSLVQRIVASTNLSACLDGAVYVQECTPESLDLKKKIFSDIDDHASPNVPIGSSTSGICASQFTEQLKGRYRCLVAHPVNPPSVVPLVELVPAPWTNRDVVQRTKEFMTRVGQEPIIVNSEINGFILNRLQGALLNEAMGLVADGFVSTEDLDKTVKHGLGLRWSFMGPMETIDINAPGGVSDYSARYGSIYHEVAKESQPRVWDESLVGKVNDERRALLPLDEHIERQRWRDRRLMALVKHKREATRTLGD